MRPRKIRLKNFGCFRGEHEVDFTSINSDLFAIAGPTGSGKSTLLDAMTWVLYGQTPRLGKQLNEHILSPGETDLAVVLEFTANGHEYRASRTLRRRPSGITPTVKLERLADSGQWLGVPETEQTSEYSNKLKDIIGLDYEGYVRAVTLPQNAFDQFLRGDDKQRREVIKALLRADTIQKIRALARSEEVEVQGLRDQAKARIENEYPGVTPEREADLAQQLEEAQEELGKLRTAHDQSQQQLGALDKLKESADALTAAEGELRALEAERETITAARDTLARAAAAQSLAPAVKAYRSREKDLRGAAEELKRAGEVATSAEDARGEAHAALERAIAARTEQQPGLKQRLEAIEGGRRDARLLTTHKGSLESAAEADDTEFDEERLNELVQLIAGARELSHLEGAVTAANEALSEQRGQLAQSRENLAGFEKDLEDIVARGKELRAAANAAKEAHEKAQVEHAAAALRHGLHEGDTCPVCEGTITSLPADPPVDLPALKQAADDAAQLVTELLGEHGRVKERVRAETDTIGKLEKAIEERYEVQASAAQERLAQALEPFAPYGSAAAEIGRALEAQRQQQLARLAKRLTAITGGRDFDELLAETQQAIERLDQAVEGAQQRLNGAETKLAGAKAKLEAAEAKERECRTSLEEAEADLKAALAASQFDTVEAAEQAIIEPAEAQRLQETVEAHDRRRGQADAKKDAAEKALDGRTYDPEAHAALRAQVSEQQRDIDARTKSVGQVQQQLDTLRERLKQLESLHESLQGYEERLAVLSNITLWLQSDRFEAYVLGHALEDLAVNASVVLHDLTDGRYELSYDGEFFVRDTWMDSYRRSVKTLSGGESFIASLALALALADTIAGRQSLGALFLDEGFGTLDADSLDSVTEVLTNLTSNGRMVGVITHVTSLTERLPARLVISKGQQGSRIAWDA